MSYTINLTLLTLFTLKYWLYFLKQFYEIDVVFLINIDYHSKETAFSLAYRFAVARTEIYFNCYLIISSYNCSEVMK